MPVTRFTTKLLGTAGDDSVDQIDGAELAVNDITYCNDLTGKKTYCYYLDESGDAESSPDCIAPNLNAGNKRHKLFAVYGAGGSSITETSVEDEAEITLDTAKTGWGTAMAGDNEEFIQFRFTAAGVVTIISNSANAINTNTDGFLCVYDAGTGIRIKNRLGATKTIRYIVNYS